jgi:ABC-2 type transport system ATP-binding protein
MPRLATRALGRDFGSRVAVRDVSLDLHAGEVLALVGPNGAGKTTIMRMLAGLIAPTRGAIEFDGERLEAATSGRLRRRVGLLTETPGLWDRLSVEDNLLVYARLHGVGRPRQVVVDALEQFGLAGRRGDRAGTLSKGMKQKVALARALLHRPDVALLDEPTAGLDPEMARSVRDLVVGMKARGQAVLLSTHNLDEAERVADRVAVLRQTLVAVATPDTLRRTLFGERVRVRFAGSADGFRAVADAAGATGIVVDGDELACGVATPERDVPTLVRALVEAGAAVRAVHQERPPLEEIYLSVLEREAAE